MFRRKVSTIVLGLAVAIATVLPAVPASADATGDYKGEGIRIRNAANTNSVIRGLGYAGDGITLHCSVGKGQSVNGRRFWGRHKNNARGTSGYSHGDYLIPRNGTWRHYESKSSC